MGSVYSASACAFIWLGPGNEGSDRAVTLIDSLQQILLEHVPDIHAMRMGFDKIKLPEDIVLPSDDKAWADLEALFSRPWFSRSWTFQEPLRAPARLIACGSKILGWDTFLNALLLLDTLRCRDETVARSIPLFEVQACIDKKPEDLRLSYLMYITWAREASDPRDKVYALYGLVQGYQKVPLEISYTKSVEDVYRSTVRFCIENEGNLSILRQVSGFRSQPGFCSWVPDWRGRLKLGYPPMGMDVLNFHASYGYRPLLVPSFRNDMLILKGFILAIVERTFNTAALAVNPSDSSPDSWITNAAAAGVPVRFLQGRIFQTSYDLTITTEDIARPGIGVRYRWPERTQWVAAGSQTPIPHAVLREYTEFIGKRTANRILFMSKDTLGLAPATTKV